MLPFDSGKPSRQAALYIILTELLRHFTIDFCHVVEDIYC